MVKDHIGIWENCLKVIKDNISAQAFKTWFAPIIPVKIDNNILTIQVPSHFFYEWLEEHYITLLSRVVRKELGTEASLEYSILMESNHKNAIPYTVKLPTQNNNSIRNSPVSIPLNTHEKQIRNPFIIPGLKKINIESNLMPQFNLDNFVEGEYNRLARASGYAVANKPGGTAFNPLLIYGAVGLGKTHLANAIGIAIKDKHPSKTVLYVQSEKFAHQFIDAIKNQTTNDFVHFYQMIDVLIIDDVQFFAGKEKTQDVFFSIFNHLHQNGKQIVLTSDKAPVELQGMEQRLLSRFKWGLSADLQCPSLETRIAILRKKMYADGIDLPDEVVEYLAYSITTNIRELEGALIRVTAYANLTREPASVEMAQHQLADLLTATAPKNRTDEEMLAEIAEFMGFSVEALKGKSRQRPLVSARQIAMYVFRDMTELSYPAIARLFGGRDHTTVIHAVDKTQRLMREDKHTFDLVTTITARIKNS